MRIKIPQPRLNFATSGAKGLLAGFVLIGNFILMLVLLPIRFSIWILDNWFLLLCIFIAMEYTGISNIHKIPEVQEFTGAVEHRLSEIKAANERANRNLPAPKQAEND